MHTPIGLKRSISLSLLTLYGLGTILGAGVYVLIGKVAGLAGMYAPFAFLVASLVAGGTAFSYAELSSRYPRSAGESAYILEAFNKKWLSSIVGWLVVLTGIVSAATLIRGFVGYFQVFIELPAELIIILLLGALTGIAAWGITQSVAFATIVTILEVFGLFLIFAFLHKHFFDLPTRWPELLPEANFFSSTWIGIFLGGYLAFYAFIGFEDMVNVAEEVKDPKRNLPRAIIMALFFATALYFLVAVLAVLALTPEELAVTEAPFATLLASHSLWAKQLISLISLIAIVNGAMVQLIMASRVIYGMSNQGMIPAIFAKVHPKTQTPLHATLLVALFILSFSLWFPLVTLAKLTSFIVLLIFLLVNLALFKVKGEIPKAEGSPAYPRWLPVVSMLLCGGLLLVQLSFGG